MIACLEFGNLSPTLQPPPEKACKIRILTETLRSEKARAAAYVHIYHGTPCKKPCKAM
jgi:hypothetical protein